MKPRRLAVYGLTAGLLGGGAAGLLMTGTTLASAQTADVTGTVADPAATTDSTTTDSTAADSGESSTTTAPAASDPSTTTAPAAPATPDPAAGSAKAPRNDWAKSTLDSLVAKGTITQAQADEVLAALEAARPAEGPGHGPGRGGFGKLDAAAKVLGMTVEDLRTALQGGKSLADVAKDKGIDVAKVVDALVNELKAHLDAEVKSGEHTQAQADQMLADARTRIQAFVNGEAPAGGPGFGGGHGPGGPGRPGGPASSGSTSGSTTTS
jgi:hypothetical protein